MDRPTRREFLKTGALAGLGALGGDLLGARATLAGEVPRLASAGLAAPVVIASRNGLRATERAMELLEAGSDSLEAVVAGVNIVEGDPEDRGVGYGGLPNALGVVQLDASVMHGPTRGAGAVAALEGFKHPSRVAMAVMQYTDHVLLVGEGAKRFALEMGFKEENILTDSARRRWLDWRAGLSPDDDYLTPEQSEEGVSGFGLLDAWEGRRRYGTINCCAVDAAGNLSGVTTTSGLSFKVPGRVGDSPIIGAGLYVDNDVGAVGSTGRGEAAIKSCGSMLIVERMRHGLAPVDACLEALRRIVRFTVEKRLLDEDGHPNFNVNFYAVNKRGEHGAAAIWSGSRYAVYDSKGNRLEDSAYLLERAS
ncbi:MAG: N(4)-(beta-N-acetylglucosaminyl)-L-asparaginase [Gemmatimonadota bacterium]|nr:MAG: N(4)-(beta-N-acetylglucosaminyl)-L-asparaginase [Gemmatimonadota bacterium]